MKNMNEKVKKNLSKVKKYFKRDKNTIQKNEKTKKTEK